MHEFPWWPNLSWASTTTVYFQDLGITRARNCLPESMMCLYSSPFTWVKISNSCYSALPFNNHLEICLQNGSVLCICSNVSNLSTVSSFGVGVVSWEICGETSGCGIEVVLGEVFCVWLLVLKVGLSVCVAVSMLTVVDVNVGSTNHERQSAALFLAPGIHSKVIFYVASSRLHLLIWLFAFFPLRNFASGLWSLFRVMSVPCR